MKKIRKIKICGKILKPGHIIMTVYGRASIHRIKDNYTIWILRDFKIKEYPNGYHIIIQDKDIGIFIKPQLHK